MASMIAEGDIGEVEHSVLLLLVKTGEN